MIYSSSYIWSTFKYNNPYKYVIQQGLFFVIGCILMIVFSKIDYNIYKKHANTFLGICFLLLILVLIPGIGSVRNGSRSWFGILGFGFQPSELSKLALIIFTSKYLDKNDKLKRNYFAKFHHQSKHRQRRIKRSSFSESKYIHKYMELN